MNLFFFKKRIRLNFGKFSDNKKIPNLIKIQKKSYENFLQISTKKNKRRDMGLEKIFRLYLKSKGVENSVKVKYKNYTLKSPKYTPQQCIDRGVNYSSALKVSIDLILYENNKKKIKKRKNYDIYIGDIPMMTNNGTFIINGAQRVIVSQLQRCPGVFYFIEKDNVFYGNKKIHCARIIPKKGCWLDMEIDNKNILYFRIDRKKKLPISILYRAIGYSIEEILNIFYDIKILNLENNKINYLDKKKKFLNEEKEFEIEKMYTEYSILAQDISHPKRKKVIYAVGSKINNEIIKDIKKMKIKSILIVNIEKEDRENSIIYKTIQIDKNKNREECIKSIYKVTKSSILEEKVDENFIKNIFFSKEKYNLSRIGRIKMNKKHGLKINEKVGILTGDDIIAMSRHLINIKRGIKKIDEIDSLSNRRVKTVGELVESQFQIGMIKMQKSILEKVSTNDINSIMSYEIINSKIITNQIREFFCLSQLSQFMDQTNPLSEITHKRRLSALGPGGLTKERAGFEVRDVHYSHYSRICPIETPEGQNIGLINSLAVYAEIDKYGFIKSPYRKINKGFVTDKVVKLTAVEEENFYIAQNNLTTDNKKKILEKIVNCHKNGEILKIERNKIDFMNISPQQIVSVATALIPFLENNDANRALMGSNMQRQAVPLLISEAPIIGTGMEEIVSKDSGANVMAKRTGIVEQVDSTKIIIRTNKKYIQNKLNKDNFGIDIYKMIKYKKSNQGTCINQIPIVNRGQTVEKGETIADGPSSDKGELSLGKNVLVSFMPWNGYNFEDSVIISNRLVKEDVFTSIHINEYEVTARDTRLGSEEITRNILGPNKEKLDKNGIIKNGSYVKQGDILVGKTTPKNEEVLTPEEKLLRAIFGEKSNNLKNSSLKVSSGEEGIVVNVKIFNKKGVKKNERALQIEKNNIDNLIKDKQDEVKISRKYINHQLKKIFGNDKEIIDNKKIEELSKKNNIYKKCIEKIKIKEVKEKFIKLIEFYINYKKNIKYLYIKKIEKLKIGDDLPQGVISIVKIYTLKKAKIQTGDKMAGRHGNKGVVSKIVPIEEMPYLENGKPIDIILNPLGVPSRMNIGQILETHMGLISAKIGKVIYKYIYDSILRDNKRDYKDLSNKLERKFNNKKINTIPKILMKLDRYKIIEICKDLKKGIKISTPAFDGIKEKTIDSLLEKMYNENSGQLNIRDGKTGYFFERKVTVGYIYMLKLDHLIDNKMHARSIGPYSLVTQQPLGGKSHCGGQRFGEMECWALQAYGAAYTLREMITVKSDDILGRVKAYESIIKQKNSFEVGLPESFKVMIKEIRSLCLNIDIANK